MKKFKEEVRKNGGGCFEVFKNGKTTYEIQGLTSSPLIIFRDWVSPEDHQAEVDKRKQQYEEHQEIYSKTAKKLNEAELELSKLKSQLEKQKPEIPEVPPFVAEWLDRKPLYAINGSIPVEIIEWSQKQTGYADLGMNINHLLKLKINGYTVAKEKLYKVVFPKSHSVLCKTGEVVSFAETVYEKYLLENAMTESEIKAIDERYWAFAVLVEEK